ncbi:hypothetical protein F1654_11675 [Alkalicaulis satelles]|uniref:Uncharacterized protein n=1 Tax=Alkalicaulis satelles TaxID=2609175 RepID=A0A5M6ZA37_9PROT|nr:hypothetical protein [Alkalicaulis satelles]KAA5801553.1 hypothetical protein F1654_11675 [Alkalicaulis satelles]
MITPALAALALAFSEAPPAAPADYDALLLLQAGDEACALLTPVERGYLEAVLAQARDDAILAGATSAEISARARIEAPACTDSALEAAAASHRARLAELSELSWPVLPGRLREWRVRPPLTQGRTGWRVSQPLGEAPAMFGLYESRTARAPAAAWRSDRMAAHIVLVLRDPARQAEPVDRTAGGMRSAPGADPVSAWGAYSGGEQRFLSSARLDAETAAHLAPAGAGQAQGFVFPDAALAALSALEPRESARLDIRARDGALAGRFWIEAGALRAALMLASEADARPQAQPVTPSR